MTTTFKEFGLHPSLQSALDSMQFDTPTPIQAMAIPLALAGQDILGSAQTGTGKTAAFCVPMINYLINNHTAHALVMLPTRELASQVHSVARKMIGRENIKSALLIGGEPIGKQYGQLRQNPRLIVGTPGRINDHLRGNQDLVERVSFVVLDEADRMLDMGFAPQIDSILSETALERQTLMFSATFPDNIVKFTKQYLNNPERVSIGTQSKPGENIVQESVVLSQEGKYQELQAQLASREGSVIVFVRTQHGADKLAAKLNKDSHTSEAIHGGLRQRQRDKVISQFRKSDIRILVATDVAARGLDVPHIEHVINYDLPQVAEDYIHRIGRTARGGAKGHAVSFIAPGEKHLWRDIERLLNPNAANANEPREGGRGGFGGKKKFGGGKPYGKKPFGDRSGQRDGERKPFKRREEGEGRSFDRKPKWHPDGDFRREEGKPAQSLKKPFKKRDDNDFARDPDSYKRTTSGERKEGGYKKPFRRDENSSDRPRREGGDRPFFKKDDNRDGQKRTEGGFKKPFQKRDQDGNAPKRSYDKPFRKEDGFKKPFKKDDSRSSSFKKPGGAKPFAKRNDGFKKTGTAKKRPE
jgi:ATP-dependent RNA helicase DeaD